MTSIFLSIGVYNYVSSLGNNRPADGPTNNDGSPSGEVSYTFVADSVFSPLMGVANGLLTLASNLFNLAAVAAGKPETIAPGGTLSFTRKFVVATSNGSLGIGFKDANSSSRTRTARSGLAFIPIQATRAAPVP